MHMDISLCSLQISFSATLGLFDPCALATYITYLPYRTNSFYLPLLTVITQDINTWITQDVITNIFLIHLHLLLNLTNHVIYILWKTKGNSQFLIPHLFKQCQHDFLRVCLKLLRASVWSIFYIKCTRFYSSSYSTAVCQVIEITPLAWTYFYFTVKHCGYFMANIGKEYLNLYDSV